MKLLIVTPTIEVACGGPSYSSINLARALADLGIDVTLFTTTPNGTVPAGAGNGFALKYFRRSFPMRYLNSGPLLSELADCIGRFDLLHVMNLWNFVSTRSARIASNARVPYVLTPRGMLSAWVRSFRRFDKEVYFAIAERRTVRNATALHFVSQEEERMSARFAQKTPCFTVPNGVWCEEFDMADPNAFRKRFGLEGKRLVMFLGRLHPIKQLDLQCEALRLLSKRVSDLRWVFVGPDDGVKQRLKTMLAEAGVDDRAVFTGLLSGSDRISALAAADVYCQSSEHEGHSVAITEALAAGKPCVVTSGCNFPMIEQYGAGVVVPPSAENIAQEVGKFIFDGDLARRAGDNALRLVQEHYTWQAVAEKMTEQYEVALERSKTRI